MDKVRKELAGVVAAVIGPSSESIDYQAIADAVAKRVLEMQQQALRFDNEFGKKLLQELSK